MLQNLDEDQKTFQIERIFELVKALQIQLPDLLVIMTPMYSA